jgi:hypothetical protein
LFTIVKIGCRMVSLVCDLSGEIHT